MEHDVYLLNKDNFKRFVFSLNSKINAINVKVSNTPSLTEKSGYDFKVADIKRKIPAVSNVIKRCQLSSENDKDWQVTYWGT